MINARTTLLGNTIWNGAIRKYNMERKLNKSTRGLNAPDQRGPVVIVVWREVRIYALAKVAQRRSMHERQAVQL